MLFFSISIILQFPVSQVNSSSNYDEENQPSCSIDYRASKMDSNEEDMLDMEEVEVEDQQHCLKQKVKMRQRTGAPRTQLGMLINIYFCTVYAVKPLSVCSHIHFGTICYQVLHVTAVIKDTS